MLNSQVWPSPLGCQIVPWIGMRSPTFQLKRFGQIDADDRALPIGRPGRELIGRHRNSGYTFRNDSGSTAIWAKKFDGSW